MLKLATSGNVSVKKRTQNSHLTAGHALTSRSNDSDVISCHAGSTDLRLEMWSAHWLAALHFAMIFHFTTLHRLLDNWHIDENDAPMFVYYLKRHIELDSDEHGPAAMKLIQNITKDNQNAMQQLRASAIDSIDHRALLWEGVAQAIGQ